MGKSLVSIIGARVAGTSVYTPAHIKAGATKPTGAMCEFTVLQNGYGGRIDEIKLTGWGKMADVIARSCAPGKKITITGELRSFKGRIWNKPDANNNFSFITESDGTPKLITKTGVKIDSIDLGVDSKKNIIEEINAGKRPLHWAVPGHQEQLQWEQMCAQKNAEQYIPGSVKFGYADVRVLENSTLVNPVNANNTAVGTAQFATNVQNQVVTPPIVQPQVAPTMPAQVQVNGQNMGYAVQPPTYPAAPKIVM